MRSGTEVSSDDQGSGFSLGDGGSRVGARLQRTFGETTAVFARLEAGSNILDVFSADASSGDGDEGRTLHPRLYFVAIDSPCRFASYGKNWSTCLYFLTSTVTFGTWPLNFDACSAPMASTTGVPRSMPTSAVSSAEKMPAWVCSMRPSATFSPLT